MSRFVPTATPAATPTQPPTPTPTTPTAVGTDVRTDAGAFDVASACLFCRAVSLVDFIAIIGFYSRGSPIRRSE